MHNYGRGGVNTIYSSGNDTVDRLGQLNITGNVIPMAWYKTIVRKNGKPNLNAIIILADIVYWYRPEEKRDEATGQLIGYRKKFKSDALQRSYAQIADMYGLTPRQATDAIVELEKIGVIKRDLRTIEVGGRKLNNTLYILLDADKLCEITYPKTVEEAEKRQCDTYPVLSGEGVTIKRDSSDLGMREPVTVNVDTYTQNTTKTSTKISKSIHLSESGRQIERTENEVIVVDPTEKICDEDICKFENKLKNGISFDMAAKKKEMKIAIQVLAGWNDYAQKSDYTELRKSLYVLAVECLIEMATETKICAYGETKVTYKNVIDQINKCCKSANSEIQPLGLFLDMVIERYENANMERQIKNPKSYMKSIIWNNFSTYQVDWEGFFERSYYNNL